MKEENRSQNREKRRIKINSERHLSELEQHKKPYKQKRQKRKTRRSYTKLSKGSKALITLGAVGLLSATFFFSLKAYRYINVLENKDNITQEDVYNLTKIKETDSGLLRSLKNNAFDAWLYEANMKPTAELEPNIKKLNQIYNAKIPVSELDNEVNELKEQIKKINDKDINELYSSYYLKMLDKMTKDTNKATKEAYYKNMVKMTKSAKNLTELCNKIYTQKGMNEVVNSEQFSNALASLNTVSANIRDYNDLNNKVQNYLTLSAEQPGYQTQIGTQINPTLDILNNYIRQSNIVSEFNAKFDRLKEQIASDETKLKSAIDNPNLVGLTVKQAKEAVEKLGLSIKVANAYSADTFKNGKPVSDKDLSTMRTWDGDENDVIIYQYDGPESYRYILKGLEIEVTVKNQSVEEPKEEKPKKDNNKEESSDEKDGQTSNSSEEKPQDSSSSSTSSSSSSSEETKPSESKPGESNGSNTEQSKEESN